MAFGRCLLDRTVTEPSFIGVVKRTFGPSCPLAADPFAEATETSVQSGPCSPVLAFAVASFQEYHPCPCFARLARYHTVGSP